VVIEGRGTLLARGLKESIELAERFGSGCLSDNYHLPLTITRSAKLPTDIEIHTSDSSQCISGLMMASALIDRDEMTSIVVRDAVSRPYIGLTAEIMEQFGAIVTLREEEPLRIDIEPEPYTPTKIGLHTDWSSASYFAAAYAIAQSGHQRAERYTLEAQIGTTQADEVFLMLLDTMGARLVVGKKSVEFLPSGRLSAISYDATHTPDLIPTLAIVALFAEGESIIGGLQRLRNKESNRVESIVENLVAIGADVRIEGDRLHIVGSQSLHGAPLLTHGDHRIAMAFTVAALFMSDKPTLVGTLCVAKSFPEFFQILKHNNK
jgi:3-phosphoshikimate 1-carboxyvinyltransferase